MLRTRRTAHTVTEMLACARCTIGACTVMIGNFQAPKPPSPAKDAAKQFRDTCSTAFIHAADDTNTTTAAAHPLLPSPPFPGASCWDGDTERTLAGQVVLEMCPAPQPWTLCVARHSPPPPESTSISGSPLTPSKPADSSCSPHSGRASYHTRPCLRAARARTLQRILHDACTASRRSTASSS